MENSIIKSILKINPNAQVSVSANDVKQIDWHNNTTPIAEEDILAKEKELKLEYDANKYQRDRAEAYPS